LVKEKLLIKRLVVDEFEYEKHDVGFDYGFNMVWRPGNVVKVRRSVLRIFTDSGVVGEYLTGGISLSPLPLFARFLIGKNALEREYLWSNIWRGLRHYAGLGLAPVDVALWDLAGKYFDAPIYELLGYYRKSLPAYASTMHADGLKGGLDGPEAYANFAEECLRRGYTAFKIHGWGFDSPGRLKQDVAAIHAVRERVGDRMNLMVDPACEYPTFANALELGRACDEARFFWLEDPFRDGGVSAFAHRKLRQLIRTPLLQTEHLRTVYPKVDFIVAEATDFVRGDVDKDGGITGAMKVAHAAEGFGIDIEMHGGNIACQHCMAAIRNTNYLEGPGLVHPKVDTEPPEELYLGGYKGGLASIDSKGCVNITESPGLGVELNWDFIERHRTSQRKYE
jgi:L-alanine-DL-glutamate epimerase-like enolase superfamily enzyme